MLLAIQLLALVVGDRHWIERLVGVVSVDAGEGRRRAQGVVAVKERTVAECGAYAPAIDLLAEVCAALLDFLIAFLDAEPLQEALLQRQLGEIIGLARRYADVREFRAQRLLDFRFAGRRSELQQEVEVREGVGLEGVHREFGEGGRRQGVRRGLAQKLRQGLRLVLRLNLLDVFYVGGVEELGAEDRKAEVGLAVEGLGDAGGRLALPARAGDHVAAGPRSRGARADIAIIEAVKIGQLNRIIAALVDRRHAEHDRLGAQVQL